MIYPRFSALNTEPQIFVAQVTSVFTYMFLFILLPLPAPLLSYLLPTTPRQRLLWGTAVNIEYSQSSEELEDEQKRKFTYHWKPEIWKLGICESLNLGSNMIVLKDYLWYKKNEKWCPTVLYSGLCFVLFSSKFRDK